MRYYLLSLFLVINVAYGNVDTLFKYPIHSVKLEVLDESQCGQTNIGNYLSYSEFYSQLSKNDIETIDAAFPLLYCDLNNHILIFNDDQLVISKKYIKNIHNYNDFLSQSIILAKEEFGTPDNVIRKKGYQSNLQEGFIKSYGSINLEYPRFNLIFSGTYYSNSDELIFSANIFSNKFMSSINRYIYDMKKREALAVAKKIEEKRLRSENLSRLSIDELNSQIATIRHQIKKSKNNQTVLENQEELIANETELKEAIKLKNQLEKLALNYQRQIMAKVRSKWNYPGSKPTWSCEVAIKQNKGGEVLDIRTTNCQVDDKTKAQSFINSINRAVRKASPLPPAPDAGVFDEDILFNFYGEQ